jgi:Xaa-Pro aminopeptidase
MAALGSTVVTVLLQYEWRQWVDLGRMRPDRRRRVVAVRVGPGSARNGPSTRRLRWPTIEGRTCANTYLETTELVLPIPLNKPVQAAAKHVLQQLVGHITPESTETSIATAAAAMLAERGYPDTWYYNCPAFVLLGSRSKASLSGRVYEPSTEPVGLRNLVTVDLSPRSGDIWGDCARSFYVEEGVARVEPTTPEFVSGYEAESRLHRKMRAFVRPDTSFHDLYEFANAQIREEGFENLDFLGNVGHSICQHRDDRQYIEAGNHRRLGEVACFTFEPHISQHGGRWGFKHENIYYFDNSGAVMEL